MTNLFLYFWSGVIGLCLGSFTNVLILRDKDRGSIVAGRSQCMNCKHALSWYDLVPLFSFLSLRAKCRYCRKSISWQYPLVELITSGLVIGSVWYGSVLHGSFLLCGAFIIAAILLLTVSVIDLYTMELPLEYVVLAAILASGAMLVAHQLTLQSALWGIVAGAGSVAFVLYGWKLLFKQEGMGVGDIWLTGAIGAIVGYPYIWVALLVAVFSGAFVGVILLLKQKKELSTAMPFGPFLCFGLLIALVSGQNIWQWYIMGL